MTADRIIIGNNLRAARDAAGLNKPHVCAHAYLAGYETIYEQSLGRIERGERDLSLAEAVILADVIGCDLTDLTRELPAQTGDTE